MKKLTFSLILVVLLALIPLSGNVQANTTPTISIQGVSQGVKVTVQSHNFPAGRTFQVRMGLLGTQGKNGILLGTVESGAGGSLRWTFQIPAALQPEAAIAIRMDSTTGGFYSYNWFTNTTWGTHTGGSDIGTVVPSPTILPASVKKGETVVIKGIDLPVNTNFYVLMGASGTQGVGGTLVETINSGSDGNLVKSFVIPDSLKNAARVDVRFESVNTPLVLTTSFENQTGASGGSGGSIPGYTGIPTMSILSVNADKDVTVQTYNFPPGRDFKVLMGKIGTKGVGGIQVATVNSGTGGGFKATYDIPAALRGDYQIAIRLQTIDGYYFAFNWFFNNTTTGVPSGGYPSGYTGIPTFSITSVVADDKVTVTTNNFPADLDFNVMMGKMWTQGIGGIPVTTINSGAGGSFTKTFSVPAALKGNSQIAVRLVSTTGGFFAYNWFWNNTYP